MQRPGAGVRVSDPFQRLGNAVARHPWWFLGAWVIAIALGALGSHRLDRVTVGVEGGVAGSPSHRAGEVLRTEFSNPFLDPLVVAVSAPHISNAAAEAARPIVLHILTIELRRSA